MLRGERKPGKKWSGKDRAFALALTVYEADLCNGCGQPMSNTTGDHPHDYNVDSIRCMACSELEDHREESSKKPESGEKLFVVKDAYGPTA